MERNTDSSVTASQPIDKWSRRNYIAQLPDYIVSYREEIERRIKDNLEDIGGKQDILRGFNLLKSRKKLKGVKLSRRVSKKRRLRVTELKQVSRRCDELAQECWDHRMRDGVEDEYQNKIWDYLQEQLNVKFSMREENVRHKELRDVLFYYMMTGEELDKHVQKILIRLHEPCCPNWWFNCSWDELCCVLLHSDMLSQDGGRIFTQQLDRNNTAICYLLYKRPQLLLNSKSILLMGRLVENLPYDKLHQLITNIKDKKGQTHMFYLNLPFYTLWYADLYDNRIDDLYELLSTRNTNGQTALHVNSWWIIQLLALIYIPKHREKFLNLTSITDNSNKTAVQFSNELRSLVLRVENNEYVIGFNMVPYILIIYNTNNRPGAKEEAKAIYNACEAVHPAWIGNVHKKTILEEDRTEDQIIQSITRTANLRRTFTYSPAGLIVILMSHGNVGTISDCEGNPIKLSDIEAAMCTTVLDGRPKMLITQCCQIGEESVYTPAYTPTHDEFCAVMSCVSGQPSERGVFIEKLAEQIVKSKIDTNIFNLVNSVSKEMEREEHKQTPIIMSTLTAKFCPTDNWWIPK